MAKNFTIKSIGIHCKIASQTNAGAIKNYNKIIGSSKKIDVGSPIHDLLCAELDRSNCKDYVRELKGAIVGRNFRLDIAYPQSKLGIEVDGWQNHGKTKDGFQVDREKQNLYTLAGWRILRYTAADIYKRLPAVIGQIEMALQKEVG